MSKKTQRLTLKTVSNRHSTNRYRCRRNGASLVLVIAIFGGLALAILLFCLAFTGLIGSYHEQRSAIEAAALAAAKDISSIVIEDPNFGFIGLSDSAPTEAASAADDGYSTQVTGINTLFGTLRLDLITADALRDPLMKQLVLNDYQNALIAQKNLTAALQAAVAQNGTGKDIQGHTVEPAQDAVNAYSANGVHLAIGQTSALAPNTLKLSLGYVDSLSCRTPVPQPPAVASLASDDMQLQGFYVPDVVIKYGDTPFVFAALGANSTLVDHREFQSNLKDLPYATPTVVKVDADEQYKQSGGVVRTVHASAAALAGTVVDQRPYPGALTLSFPDGAVPEITQLGDTITNAQLQSDPFDNMQSPANGDYPQTPLSSYSLPVLPDLDSFHPQFEHMYSVALYDWIKRAGTNINVPSLVKALETPIAFQSGPQVQRFYVSPTGDVVNDVQPLQKSNLCVSQKQFRGISGLGLVSSNGIVYDVEVTDFCHIPGRVNGGKHAGEPLSVPGLTTNNLNGTVFVPNSMYENPTWPYHIFLDGGGGAVRPTYKSQGIALDVTFRKRQ